MTRTVQSFLPLDADAAAVEPVFAADPQTWLPSARRAGKQQWHIPVFAGTFHRNVTLTVGTPWRSGRTLWRSMQWDPEPEAGDQTNIDRLLPSLDGELGLTPDGARRSTLIVDGRYSPPGGALGAALDAVALHRVARNTVERFAVDVAARLIAGSLLDSSVPADRPTPLSGR